MFMVLAYSMLFNNEGKLPLCAPNLKFASNCIVFNDAINFLRIKRDLQLNCIDKDCDGVCPCSTGYCWGNACSCFPCQPMTDPPVNEEAQEQGRRRR